MRSFLSVGLALAVFGFFGSAAPAQGQTLRERIS